MHESISKTKSSVRTIILLYLGLVMAITFQAVFDTVFFYFKTDIWPAPYLIYVFATFLCIFVLFSITIYCVLRRPAFPLVRPSGRRLRAASTNCSPPRTKAPTRNRQSTAKGDANGGPGRHVLAGGTSGFLGLGMGGPSWAGCPARSVAPLFANGRFA